MPRYIVKLHDDKLNTDYYMEWSTIVDAPVTYGVGLDEFKRYYRDQYGEDGMRDFPNRMRRVDEKGTSSELDNSADELIRYNRAGKNETSLTKEELLEQFCRKCNT